jgi:23S rRNA-/tRNA-specific pseudouridylate synthase
VLIPLDVDRIRGTFHSKHWRFECSDPAYAEVSCVEELERRLPHIASSSWSERFELGGVYVNRLDATPDTLLIPPGRLEYFEPFVPLSRVSEQYPRFSPDYVVHCDEDLAIVFKPAGLPSTAPRDQRRYTMQRYLDDYLGRSVHLPSRLDAAVAGLMPVSLSPRMNRSLQRAYVNRTVEKYYLAEVCGGFPESLGEISSRIARDERHPILRRAVEDGGEDARTLVRIVATYDSGRRNLLRVEPVTGRTHQIRVHLAYEGFPIMGDPFYGGGESADVRLICYALSFFHPFLGQRLRVQVPPNLRPVWLRESFKASGKSETTFMEDEGL